LNKQKIAYSPRDLTQYRIGAVPLQSRRLQKAWSQNRQISFCSPILHFSFIVMHKSVWKDELDLSKFSSFRWFKRQDFSILSFKRLVRYIPEYGGNQILFLVSLIDNRNYSALSVSLRIRIIIDNSRGSSEWLIDTSCSLPEFGSRHQRLSFRTIDYRLAHWHVIY
jgi:hypothetical protein